jgi:hypothetical protein
MRTMNVTKIIESFSSIMTEKKRILEREREVIEKLNRAIGPMGYQITWTAGQAAGNRKGRPRGSRNKNLRLTLHERNSHVMKRGRPGRPKLTKVA